LGKTAPIEIFMLGLDPESCVVTTWVKGIQGISPINIGSTAATIDPSGQQSQEGTEMRQVSTIVKALHTEG
jgi:hypothetical protein